MISSSRSSSHRWIRIAAGVAVGVAALMAPTAGFDSPGAGSAGPARGVVGRAEQPEGGGHRRQWRRVRGRGRVRGSMLIGDGPEGPTYVAGRSGRIQVYRPATGSHRVLVSGLISAAGKDGSSAGGVRRACDLRIHESTRSWDCPPTPSRRRRPVLWLPGLGDIGASVQDHPSGHTRTSPIGDFDYDWTAGHLAHPPAMCRTPTRTGFWPRQARCLSRTRAPTASRR